MSKTQVVTVIIEPDSFIVAAGGPNSSDFVSLNLKLFKENTVSDLSCFRDSIVDASNQVTTKLEPESEANSRISSLLLDEAYGDLETFHYLWFLENVHCNQTNTLPVPEGHNLNVFFDKHRAEVNTFLHTKTTEPRALMDNMSIKMLQKHVGLSEKERNTLNTKVRYCGIVLHIVDLIDGVEICKQHIENKFFWEALDEYSQEEISSKVLEDIASLSSPIIEAASHGLINMMEAMKKDIDTAHVLILELIKQKKKHTTEFQTLMAFNYLIDNEHEWLLNKKFSETELVCHLNNLFKIFFANTNIVTKM
ncbi:hypothetical protein EDC96DRAFT_550002 [Choanephora cucurbitarum]|nr:hypothetical protein EDC96DRAFT_550002 [Choanephora cucurbitarum]